LVEQTFAQVRREHNRRTLMMETTRVDDSSFWLVNKRSREGYMKLRRDEKRCENSKGASL